jgi:hypothetical protein
MAYPEVTTAQFKEIKPQFDNVSDDVVQLYLNMAKRAADDSWDEDEYPAAIIAYTCHLMTIEGLGTDAASKSHAKGMADLQSVKSADITLTRFQRSAATTPYSDWLQSTPCGKQYAFMLKLAKSGPRIAMAASLPAVSGYAKDAPRNAYGWPGVFFA